MTQRDSFHRKIVYLVAMAVLAVVVFWLSTPASADKEGGQLAKLRERYGLGQANLGQVDPASETMRFLTLGLRGVAVTLLWEKANHYKMVEDWTNLTATLEQLAKLQPNFITFWKYQAWNLTYNVSVEFDDYRDRYYYVRRGIEFLKEGERYNRDNPQLLSELGWFHGHKIGRADEKTEYRRLFKNDDDYHPPDRTPDQRDNWLVSKEWYLKAIEAVDVKGKSIGKKSPREFYSDPAKSQINYAEAIEDEDEGSFEKFRRAWDLAGQEWRDFGERPILHSFGDWLQLGEEPRMKQKVDDLRAQLEAFAPGLRERLISEKSGALTEAERKLAALTEKEVPADKYNQWYALAAKVGVTDVDVYQRIARDFPDKAKAALTVLRELETADRVLRFTQSYKETANFDYWQLRCDVEQTADAVAARQFLSRAHQAAQSADLVQAKEFYLAGFQKWADVVKAFPALLDDDVVFGDLVVESTKKYRDVLDQLGETLDESYPFWDALDKFDQENVFAEERAKHKQNRAQ